MFLKSVKARGFKSFARPVEFAFEPGITVVVGPNGSGKSNIADAVVWAMGEQSPTAVRGSTMQDVIFSGSDQLAPSGMAEVEILLDNSSGVLPIEFSEVLISRRLYRDGEGQYFVNRSACRLIDVGEILSDAGLGRDGHSIISQGKVDAVLESKPSERRAHIEEAAGLGKYKKRRRRAERKLAAVRRNLDRLADVEEEVRANLRPLKRQATAAERSAKLDQQIAAARTKLIKGKLAQLARELESAESASHDAGERRRRYEQKLAETAAERRGTEELLTGSLKKHKQLASRFYDLKSRRQALEQRREFISQRRSLLARAGKRAGERIGNLQGQIERAEAELLRADDDRNQGRVNLVEVETELKARQDKLGFMLEELGHLRRENEEKSRHIGELGAIKDRCSHQVEYLTQRRKKLAADEERTAGEIEAAQRERTRLEAQLQSCRLELSSGRNELGAAEAAAAEARRVEKGLEERQEETARTLRRVAEDLKIAKARLTFLGDSDRDRAGLPPAAKKLSEERNIKALVDIIEVEPGYEQAVAAVMGRALFALTVRDMDQARELLESVRSREMGSVEFVIPGQPGDAAGGEVKDSLLRHVSVSEEWHPYISKLLAGVRVVEDAPAKPDSEGVLVTLEGVVYHGRRRLLSYRSDPPSSVVLKHRHERLRLEQECETALNKHRGLAGDLARMEEALDETREKRRAADRDFGELATAAREKDEGLEAL
jgi:chromosome segregation protein